jgi:oxazoline/thiazoline dehydrogenase
MTGEAECTSPWDPRTVVSSEGLRLATLRPLSPRFVPRDDRTDRAERYVLSRFAYSRAEDGETILECPLSAARVVLHDWRASAVLHALAHPCRVDQLQADVPGLSPEAAGALLRLLLAAGMVGRADAESESAALRCWEFHDLLFHSRSRAGRHGQAIGGTYRLAGTVDPPPVLGTSRAERWVTLYRPDLDRLEREDPPFAWVQEARRSIREYGERPLSVRQLAEFLYRVGRLADYRSATIWAPQGAVSFPLAPRPYPAGGGLYELDLYVVARSCEGLDSGLYYYDPERHRLGWLSGGPTDLDALAFDAGLAASVPPDELQVLIIAAARFQRVAWKYVSIAYSLILKDVGVLFQTMYLVATAMGLAPCAIGCGDSDAFARAAGTDYYAETSVGEFLLGSRP